MDMLFVTTISIFSIRMNYYYSFVVVFIVVVVFRGGGDGGGVCNAPPGKGCNKAGIGSQNAATGWGISLGRHGQQETFMRIDPDGTRHIVHVTWAIGH